MKILVTVGTTNFDSLIKYLDNNLDKDTDILFQIAQGKYIPMNFEYIKFTNDINTLYEKADLIITHAGAGTIYKLLNLNKKILMVPNLERVDNHQIEIAEFMHKNNYAISCTTFEQILINIKSISNLKFAQYIKDDFNKLDEICEIINKYK